MTLADLILCCPDESFIIVNRELDGDGDARYGIRARQIHPRAPNSTSKRHLTQLSVMAWVE